MAVFALRQHDAGEEGAECCGKPDELHQECDAHHHEEGEAHEDLADPRIGDEAEQGAREEAASQHDRRHGSEHGERLRPARQVADEAGAVIIMRLGRGEERQEGEDRDHRDVLEQQDREGGLPGGGLEEAALRQALQHDRGR